MKQAGKLHVDLNWEWMAMVLYSLTVALSY